MKQWISIETHELASATLIKRNNWFKMELKFFLAIQAQQDKRIGKKL